MCFYVTMLNYVAKNTRELLTHSNYIVALYHIVNFKNK